MKKIWNDSFTKEQLSKSGVFKVYFKDFPEAVYIGFSFMEGDFKKTIEFFKRELWNTFNGIAHLGGQQPKKFLEEKDFLKLSEADQEKYLIYADEQFKKMFKKFNKKEVYMLDAAYIKIVHLMKLKNFKLADLVFEIEYEYSGKETQELWEIDERILEESGCFVKGFNNPRLVDRILGDEEPEYYLPYELEAARELLKEPDLDEFFEWNACYNLVESFTAFFNLHPMAWLAHWKEINLDEVLDNFAHLTELLFKKFKKREIKVNEFQNNKDFEESTIFVKENNHPNYKLLKSITEPIKLSKFDQQKEWIENDKQFMKWTISEIIENYDSVMEFYGTPEDVKKLVNSLSKSAKKADEVLWPTFTQCKMILDLVKAFPAQGAQLYEMVMEEYEMMGPMADHGYNFILEYYIENNYLTTFLLWGF